MIDFCIVILKFEGFWGKVKKAFELPNLFVVANLLVAVRVILFYNT